MISAFQWSRQSVVSCILLGVLCGIGASILLVHEKNRGSVFSAYTLPEGSLGPLDTAGLLPGVSLSLPAGFDLSGRQEQYSAETLYEKINGKAPLYLEAGFSSLITRRFMYRQDSTLWFEVYLYDMGTSRNAFSVYSTQRRAGAAVVSSLEPNDHYKTENGLYLRQEAYYIECIGSAASPVLDEGMVAIGRELVSTDPGSDDVITELQLFPGRDLVASSFKLVLNDAFGSEALSDTFIGKYRVNGELVTAFISRKDSPEQAEQAVESYYRFLLESDGVPDAGVDSMYVVDLYGLLEIVFAEGRYIAGVHEGESRDAALEIAGRLRASLGLVDKNNPGTF